MSKQMSALHFVKSLPPVSSFGGDALLIYDRHLLKVNRGFAKWAAKFSASHAVDAGEDLKSLKNFPGHMEKLLAKTRDLSARQMTIVVAGGGSVGDFGGFIASIYKRGVRLVHLPTTWLAALDSSHGGKTALNVAGGKNQIGTFYPASAIYLVDALLRAQPEGRAHEACGEFAKIALLDGRKWVADLELSRGTPTQLLRRFLPDAIKAKYRVVRRDPKEEKGLRQILNLGHTLGHVLEAFMHLPHGVAVAQGTFFAIDWSLKRGSLSTRAHRRASTLMETQLGLFPLTEEARFRRARPTVLQARALLLQDKKRDQRGEVTFVFLKDLGRPVRESVSIDDLLHEAKAQGWIR